MTGAPLFQTPEPQRPSQDERVFRARCVQERSYEIFLTEDVFARSGRLARLLQKRRTLVVTTPTVWSIYGAQFQALREHLSADVEVLVHDCDESKKSIESAIRICELSHQLKLGRTDALLSLGGGVCHDLVAMAASLIRRGIAHVCVPTTLVGQIDAGVGIKGAVNFHGGKSYLGCYHPPEIVLVDPSFLATAPATTWNDGIAEAIKIGLSAAPYLIALIEDAATVFRAPPVETSASHLRTLLRQAVHHMLTQLSTNFFEDQTYERLVDFGHTFSGTLEELSGYRVSHGQAVAIDMALSASVATTLGLLQPTDFARILRLVSACGLPTTSELMTPTSCRSALENAALHRGGTPNLVVPTSIGSCRFLTDLDTLDEPMLAASLRRVVEFSESNAR